jgi:NADH-quinone oxidoreductase subunit J
MTAVQIVFILSAVITVSSAVMVVTAGKMLHAALWLVAALFGVAMLFATLQAGFFAVVQVLVYIGAIAILLIFAVMLTRRVMEDTGPQLVERWWWAALAALLVYGGLVFMLRSWTAFQTLPGNIVDDTPIIQGLGEALVSPDAFMIPFEVASVLLLAALVGAIYIAVARKEEE